MRPSHKWFWFVFPLVEKMARTLSTNHRTQESKREITFDTELKSALKLELPLKQFLCPRFQLEKRPTLPVAYHNLFCEVMEANLQFQVWLKVFCNGQAKCEQSPTDQA